MGGGAAEGAKWFPEYFWRDLLLVLIKYQFKQSTEEFL
jgi:hypothetical protein